MMRLARQVIGILFCVFSGSFSFAAELPCEDPRPLRFSLIPKKDLDTQLRNYRPLVSLLEKKLERRIETVYSNSYSAVIEGLLAGGIDIAELGAASYSLAKKRDPDAIEAFVSHAHTEGRYTPQGVNYHSLLIVKASSRFMTIGDLKGQDISLTDPASTSGSVIPRKVFSNVIGKPLEEYFNHILFAGSHERAAQAVMRGHTDAAFVASTRLDEALDKRMFEPNSFRVLWKSDKIPNEPTVFRANLCGHVKQKIREVYLGDDPALKSVLHKLMHKNFTPVTDSNYRRIQALVAD